ncbi:amidohydrolase family protein [Pseudoalteromonas obscura]|uniref:Amidohydrolase family protein n=1 Tax=Pseudoalteromonas obscura TaxID=3048491 RepID=A0ABT7EIW1_9GAMM|nr:amidohydrolase family protein [Pseudoalteromonas sp. P94(2023)]MDK2594965.1 amidohydrolase family protein [Pseudoalteromonas sp. P94(2023)]
MKIIDPHLHFFDLEKGQYQWLKHNPPAWNNIEQIKQNHLPSDLQDMSSVSVAACVHVEAGFDNSNPINELQWLESVVPPLPYKAVAYAKIDNPPELFNAALKKLHHPSLAAIRDITEGEDAERLLSPNVIRNIQHLSELGLHFEAQFEVHNSAVSEHLFEIHQTHKNSRLVINHAGFMTCRDNWQDNIEKLAKLNNCFIKFSGQELLDAPMNPQQQLDVLLTQFGPTRVMLASNHPVCLIEHDYQRQWAHYYELVQQIDPTLWQALSFDNAKRIYGFTL